MSLKGEICAAIRDKAELEIRYGGGGARIVMPFICGVSKAGNDVLSAYQLRGHSESGAAAGWKMFTLEKISRIKRTGATFDGKRADYNPDDPSFRSVYRRI